MYCSIFVFGLSALLSFAICESTKEEMAETREKCINETGVDPQVVENFVESTDAEITDELKCYIACGLRQRGLFKPDGTFDVIKATSHIPVYAPTREEVVEAVNECAHERGVNACETAAAIIMCIRERQRPFWRPEH